MSQSVLNIKVAKVCLSPRKFNLVHQTVFPCERAGSEDEAQTTMHIPLVNSTQKGPHYLWEVGGMLLLCHTPLEMLQIATEPAQLT